MLFKDLKQGYPVYLLNRSDINYESGSVVSASVPHVDNKLGGMNMVVDITADFSGDRKTFCMVADSEVAYPEGRVLATDISHIKREVESMKLQSEQALAQVEKNKSILEKCKTLLAELDPTQREKQENEARFAKLEGSIDKLSQLIEQFIK